MSQQTPREPTPSTSDHTEGDTEEWTGGHQKQRPPRQDAKVSDLPELEEDEDSIVSTDNS
jgi:hypothetical protein